MPRVVFDLFPPPNDVFAALLLGRRVGLTAMLLGCLMVFVAVDG